MLYSIGIYLYGTLIHLAALFNKKARLWVDGRKLFWSNLPDVSTQDVIWFHCASLGEYDQGKPIMEAWKMAHPNVFILVTFFSPSGYKHIKNKSIADFTCYIPLDTPRNAKRFVNHFQPKKVFFVKYEIWVNHIKAAAKIGSRLFLLSAVFRGTQHFFKWYGGVSRRALQSFEHIFVQYEFNESLLYTIDIENCTTSGDTRYDRVVERAAQKNENSIIKSWKDETGIFVIGSSWPKDEAMLLPLINEGKITQKIIIAPHEVNETHITWITEQLKVPFQRYTAIQTGKESLVPSSKILILDCIGVLADAYRYGSIAYVGGAFGTGLHNILEPAAFGLPVIFGPLHQKFLEAQEFIDEGIGKSCGSETYFLRYYQDFLHEKEIHNKVKKFIAKKKGATQIVMNYFEA